MVRNHPRYEHFRKQAFDAATWADLFGALGSKAKIYADIFGFDALAIGRKAAIAGYKIDSSDLANTPLLAAAAADRKPMLLAVGGSTMREIETALGRSREPRAGDVAAWLPELSDGGRAV